MTHDDECLLLTGCCFYFFASLPIREQGVLRAWFLPNPRNPCTFGNAHAVHCFLLLHLVPDLALALSVQPSSIDRVPGA
jgi:hypothetical protein